MPEKIVPLTTEHLPIMREDFAGLGRNIADIGRKMESGFDDLKKRLARVEQTIIGLKRDETETAAELTEHRHTLDKLESIIKEMRSRLDVLESRPAH